MQVDMKLHSSVRGLAHIIGGGHKRMSVRHSASDEKGPGHPEGQQNFLHNQSPLNRNSLARRCRSGSIGMADNANACDPVAHVEHLQGKIGESGPSGGVNFRRTCPEIYARKLLAGGYVSRKKRQSNRRCDQQMPHLAAEPSSLEGEGVARSTTLEW
jgi:hypothetical protein